MCSVVILHRPDHAWPLILGANRDEMAGRPWAPPARHWPDRRNVVAGLDKLAGGSWLGLNDEGVVAAIMNRMNTLGPQPGRRSRGELVLEALDHADAAAAAEALSALDPAAYRAFNMVVADNRDAFWLRNLGHAKGWIEAWPLPPGVSMITAHDRNDTAEEPAHALLSAALRTGRTPRPRERRLAVVGSAARQRRQRRRRPADRRHGLRDPLGIRHRVQFADRPAGRRPQTPPALALRPRPPGRTSVRRCGYVVARVNV